MLAGILEVLVKILSFYHFSKKVQSAPLAVGRLTRSRFRDKEPQEKKTEGKKKSTKSKSKSTKSMKKSK